MQYHLSYGKGITGRRRKPGFLKLKSKKQAAPAKSPSPKLHLNAKPVKVWFPPDVKTKAEKEFYQAVSLKPVGGWTEGMVENGNALVIKHWERVKEYVKEHPYTGKSKKEAEEWIKKVIMTPEQEVVMWAEDCCRLPCPMRAMKNTCRPSRRLSARNNSVNSSVVNLWLVMVRKKIACYG